MNLDNHYALEHHQLKLSKGVAPVITIYHFPNTRGLRTIWACEELNIPYKIEIIDFSPEFRLSPQFLSISPIGKVPVLKDGEITMRESGAMVHYLIDKYGKGKLQPSKNDPLYAAYLEWSWFAEATFASSVSEIIRHKRAFPNAIHTPTIVEFKKRATICLEAVGGVLGKRKWLLGEMFSGADIMIGIALTSYIRHVEEPFPTSINDYFKRLTTRPAFLRTKQAES